ncbi:MAG: hypothetical protein QM727_09245 [Niabella sp.]
MKKLILILTTVLPVYLFATIWYVGPSRTYTKPSQVASLVNHGDTVYIDAADYIGDVCAWTKNNLVLIGVNGRPHLRANGVNAMGKGIWIFSGNNITAKNIEFSEASVPDKNGAGIRLEGLGINIENCYFHNNENGILTGNNGGKIVIRNSEFGYNGDGEGYAHNLYIGHVDTALIQYNYFHRARVGHEFKSRARVNYLLYNRFSDESTGTASRNIDLPNGGVSYLIGNIIEQGPNSANSNMVGYGLEGLNNTAPHAFFAINNTLVNNKSTGSFFHIQNGTGTIKVYNNIFSGPGTVINFGGGTATIDSSNNLVQTNISLVGFLNPSDYDYQITQNPAVINKGTAPGTGLNGFSLLPASEYAHPAGGRRRSMQGNIDIGAYEASGEIPLPVNYGTIEANIKNGILNVTWLTTQESNNKYFNIELSHDSIHFTSIGQVSSKGNDGYSTTALNYDFSIPMQSISFGLLIGILLIGGNCFKRKKHIVYLPVVLALLLILNACSKHANNAAEKQQTVYIRISQTDINNKITYSKIIRANIKE